ncbi:ran-binding protein 3b isoform X1 [Periophthalmus magnuspinnatus]|uniref:ran-binding protein 3b isoform X1 n=1 Tax=Periophthalmus magnuspinnatus TaxID=409849 RepID=UPI00145A9388|nr:ran-binding protein 3b isoform X1 [Periophthalmus magnuspinnatus]
MADLANEDKPAIAPPVFVFQKDKTAQKRSADGSSAEDGEDSDKDEGNYCPPVKRERTSSFPPPHSVSKNNVFMPSSFSQSPTGNSDSEPEEKPTGFRLKPPTLIHGQAPSSGVPSQKPKEQQRSVLRPAVLQAPPSKSHIDSNSSCGTNGVKKSEEASATSLFLNNTEHLGGQTKSLKHENEEDGASSNKEGGGAEKSSDVAISFVFGQNIKDRAKLEENNTDDKSKDSASSDSQSETTNYFLQYISTPSSKNAANSTDGGAKFVFGQNMSDRVLSPPKGELAAEETKEAPDASPSSQENTPEKANNASESLEESAAAYTKATAKKCVLEKVEVKTGEESESNVLQMQCKLYVFEKTAQTWIERGRGLLRLNDMASTEDGALQSRLVMRTQGSLRLILNTKLWAQMQVDKASEKSVRITAMDTEDQGVKVFLISGSSKDIGQLAAALHHRILALKSKAEQEPEVPAVTVPEPDIPQSNEEDSDEEESANATASTTANSTSEGTEGQAAGST